MEEGNQAPEVFKSTLKIVNWKRCCYFYFLFKLLSTMRHLVKLQDFQNSSRGTRFVSSRSDKGCRSKPGLYLYHPLQPFCEEGHINANHRHFWIKALTAPKAVAMATPAPHFMRFQSLWARMEPAANSVSKAGSPEPLSGRKVSSISRPT